MTATIKEEKGAAAEGCDGCGREATGDRGLGSGEEEVRGAGFVDGVAAKGTRD
jgi:hypothetical protein